MYSIQEGLSQYDNLSNSAIRGMAEDAKKGAKTILNKFETQTEQISIEKAKVQFQKFSLADQEILQETAERFLQNVKSIVIEGPQKQHAQLCTLFLNKAVMSGANFNGEDRANLQKKLMDIRELWDPLAATNPERSMSVSMTLHVNIS